MLLYDDPQRHEKREKVFYYQFAHESGDAKMEARNLAKVACTFKDGQHVRLTSTLDFVDVNIAINDV